MPSVDDVDRLIEQYQLGLEEFVKGNPEAVKELFSHRDDVTLANPLGPPARGWEQVAATIERVKAKVGGREDTAQTALRVTMIFRPEDGAWKVVHRHADPITTPQPAESVIQE